MKTGDSVLNRSGSHLRIDSVNHRHEFLPPFSVPGIEEMHLYLLLWYQSCEQYPSFLVAISCFINMFNAYQRIGASSVVSLLATGSVILILMIRVDCYPSLDTR